MRSKRKSGLFLVLTIVPFTLFLAGCVSLAGDVTPPPNYRPPTPAPTAQQVQVVFPLVPPNPQQGQAIYTEKCAPCHGTTGLGDGPQAANLPNPPAAIGSTEVARVARPVDWFLIVSNGKIENFMPGFAGSLDDAQRWNVIAYVYSLSMAPETLKQGKELYTQNCASCHGDQGRGDGSKASTLKTKMSDWTKQSSLAELSDVNMVELITNGKNEMPGMGSALGADQGWALAAYVRSLSFASANQPGQVASGSLPGAATPGATPAQGYPAPKSTPNATALAGLTKIMVTGTVTNGTPGGSVPSGVKVSLLAFDSNMNQTATLQADIHPDGSYQFKDVDFVSTNVYMVRADINGNTFNSDILHGTDVKGQQVDLPVKIYDTSADMSSLKADRLHVFFDFSKAGVVQVVELFIISNPTSKMIVASKPDAAVLNFDLPDGATNLQFQDSTIGQRYIQTPKGFGDRESIPPGQSQHQVLFAYEMAYSSKIAFDVASPLPVDAAMVMVPQSGITLNSSQFQDAGDQTVQGMNFKLYQSTGSFQPGQLINLKLEGQVGSSGASGGMDPYIPMIIGGAVFLLVLAAGGYWFLSKRKILQPVPVLTEDERPVDGNGESSEALIDAIITLEDQYQAGGLPEPAYQSRRGELKARLALALEKEK